MPAFDFSWLSCFPWWGERPSSPSPNEIRSVFPSTEPDRGSIDRLAPPKQPYQTPAPTSTGCHLQPLDRRLSFKANNFKCANNLQTPSRSQPQLEGCSAPSPSLDEAYFNPIGCAPYGRKEVGSSTLPRRHPSAGSRGQNLDHPVSPFSSVPNSRKSPGSSARPLHSDKVHSSFMDLESPPEKTLWDKLARRFNGKSLTLAPS
ncbi:uncharacterized protein MCYG_07771 [Microsporum canis CBS 113480]|uniref:Uncharacterized protein n=1 Tax=Arthroderma otae (strain ATCC MYA-4605 / CBS 113480) TaxID=554155 RepID=C5FXB2_ARTOC|nr:uncharacterized protein MCYG_07771 [Microsporum canis CBS 113480]EEQ34952.1 predicted protein [Microsporum canis CBS 113480]